MKQAIELPTICFRGLRWFVDVRLEELRQADTGNYTPLSFEGFEKEASEGEWQDLIEAILIYFDARKNALLN